ncbi:MAG: hypothetical protein ACTHU0_00145 [Kofleriaceae bacterium]
MRRSFQIYTARSGEYGNDKYERANYRRPTGGAHHSEPTAEDFIRYRSYLRAARDHIDDTLDLMELHLALDPELKDIEGMKRAAYAVDTDTTPGAKVGPSLLPHVAPACASLNMAVTQATDCGLLPRDPGTPWRDAKPEPAEAPNADLIVSRQCGSSHRFDSDIPGMRVHCVLGDGHDREHEDLRGRWWRASL